MITESSAGVPLYYEVRGDDGAPPLVLLPGASQSHVLFVDNGLADLFAEHFQLVLMDFTGLGGSGRVTEMAPQQWAQDVISVVDAIGLERVHLAGSSLGARVAARVAADHPERVSTLLVDMPIIGVNEDQERELHAFFSGYATNPLAAAAQRQHAPQWREAMDFFVATRQTSGFREYYTPSSYLGDITAPTLLSRGDNDHPVHPIAQAIAWHAAAKQSWLWIEPGASNMALMQACPDRVVAQYTRFVAAMAAP